MRRRHSTRGEVSLNNQPASPFDLSGDHAYRAWRERKLSDYPDTAGQLRVPVRDIAAPDEADSAAILALCRKTNMAIYHTTGDRAADKHALRAFGRHFGLERLDMNLRADEDSITSLRIVPAGAATHYIPYTDRPINWHTDGYYNSPREQVRGIAMHCVQPAISGGTNFLMDHEMLYLLMRDENPRWVTALMQPDAMTIPANTENGTEIRPARSGPVFSVEKASGRLHMRYTARTRSIAWKDDADVRMATGFMSEVFASDLPWIYRYRLGAGEGIICNNVLHGREAFDDEGGSTRLLYRARYHDRIKGTEMTAGTGEACSG